MDDESTDSFDLKMANDEVDIFQTLASNQMSSSMNETDQQCIQKIETYLVNSFKEYSSASTLTSNARFQNNEGGTNNIEGQEQFQQINNDNSAMNSNLDHMDIDDVDKESEQISSNTNITTNEEQHIDEHNDEQTSLPLTTDDTYTGEQQMNALEYCRRLLEIFTLAVNTMEPVLINWAIPAKTGDYYLENLPIPLPNEMNVSAQDPLNKLLDLLQTGTDILSSFHPVCHTNNANHTDPIGKESNESAERMTSAPHEHNGSHLNQQIQASTRSNTLVSSTSKDNSSSASINPLSRLLLQEVLQSFEENHLITLKFIHQPKPLWHYRTITDLANKDGPFLQSITERQYIIIELVNLMNDKEDDLFVHVQLLTYDNKPHSSKVIVPPETTVTNEKLECLTIKKAYGWNLSMNTILFPYSIVKYVKPVKHVKPVKPVEHVKPNVHQIQLKVIMFNKYQDKKFGGSNGIQASTIDNEGHKNEKDEFIEDELLHNIFKLRIQICQQTAAGQLERVSEILDTHLIRESVATEELKTIDKSKITLEKPCQCGNGKLIASLNTRSEKAGFVVKINGKQLLSHEFSDSNRGTIQITPPSKTTPETETFHLYIGKINVRETIMQNIDLYKEPVEDRLWDGDIKYADGNNNSHQCNQKKNRKKKHKALNLTEQE